MAERYISLFVIFNTHMCVTCIRSICLVDLVLARSHARLLRLRVFVHFVFACMPPMRVFLRKTYFKMKTSREDCFRSSFLFFFFSVFAVFVSFLIRLFDECCSLVIAECVCVCVSANVLKVWEMCRCESFQLNSLKGSCSLPLRLIHLSHLLRFAFSTRWWWWCWLLMYGCTNDWCSFSILMIEIKMNVMISDEN